MSAQASQAAAEPPRLSRFEGFGRPAAPVRIVHLGLGNFFRAHQAWYTDRASDADGWGIAAFTGRRPDTARALAPQDGLYVLIERGPQQDRFEVIGALSAVHAADDHDSFLNYLRNEDTVLVTLTVTEAGYVRDESGHLDVTNLSVVHDVRSLRQDPTAPVVTVPGRLVAGLLARQGADAGAITILPCDNLADNGAVTATVVRELAALVGPGICAWIAENVEFATSMVDRITPATTDADRAEVRRECGVDDAAPVPTEPFSEWVIRGRFEAGRPRWEDAGALLVEDVEPYERRKLLLLNGSHSLLAYAGSILGHATVADAIADPRCRDWVEQWWQDATPSMTVPAADVLRYREALLTRYANPRIRHLLAQIASDGSQKLPLRTVPVLLAEREHGRLPLGAVTTIAAWIAHLRGAGAPVHDVAADVWVPRAAGTPRSAAERVLTALAPTLAGDDELLNALTARVEDFEDLARR
ncbi:MAG: mannitol dehydrogenase family protein [Cellulomonadaceae bacterium]